MLNKAKDDGIKEVVLYQNTKGLFVSSVDNQYILNMQQVKVSGVDEIMISGSKLLDSPWVILNLCEINQVTSDEAQKAMNDQSVVRSDAATDQSSDSLPVARIHDNRIFLYWSKLNW